MDGDDAVVGDEANPLEVAQDGVMSQFAESLANLNIQEEQPQMHAMLLNLSQSLSTLSLAQDLLSKQSKDRKLKVEAAVKSISNPNNFRVLHLRIRLGSFPLQPLWRPSANTCPIIWTLPRLSVLLEGAVAVGGVVALAVAHMVEDVVGVVVDVVVEGVEEATRQWVSTLPSLAELPSLAMVGVTAAGDHILSALAPSLYRRTD